MFRHVEAASLRGAWDDPGAMWLAMKGGDNAANHSNLDLGTFVLEAGGQRFGVDLGADDYALPGYFGRQRSVYYRIATAGQNTLLVDGLDQPATARARITGFRTTPDFACAVVDLGAAYPALRAARRGIALVGRQVGVLVDEIEGGAGHDIHWQMHTGAAIGADGPTARLSLAGVTLHAHVLEPPDARFTIEPAAQSPPQNPNAGISRLRVDLPRREALRVAIAFSRDAPADGASLGPAAGRLADWAA